MDYLAERLAQLAQTFSSLPAAAAAEFQQPHSVVAAELVDLELAI